ncbi:MAG: hypothetical protein WC323_01805 [Patescibacteria group bacterium]|jgi:hypothetical protein
MFGFKEGISLPALFCAVLFFTPSFVLFFLWNNSLKRNMEPEERGLRKRALLWSAALFWVAEIPYIYSVGFNFFSVTGILLTLASTILFFVSLIPKLGRGMPPGIQSTAEKIRDISIALFIPGLLIQSPALWI